MIVFLMGVVSPLVLGYCLLRLFAPRLGMVAQMSIGAGIGAGVISCCFFISLMTGLPSLLLEGLALIAAVTFCPKQRVRQVPILWTSSDKLLGVIFGLAAIAGGLAFCAQLWNQPHGGWDSFAIWNVRARFLASPLWRDSFSGFLIYSHPDYPLLLAGFIARIWRSTGGRELAAPALAAALFTFGTVGVLVASLALLKGRTQGFLAGILLLSTHFFVAHGASEYADVPVGFFILCTVAAFALAMRYSDQPWLLVLIGLSAGLAAWTKNEGWILIVAVAAISLLMCRRHVRQIALIAAGLAPVLAIILCFKIRLATANDFVSGRSLHSLVTLISNPARYLEVGRGLLLATDFLIPVLGVAICSLCSLRGEISMRSTALICAVALGIVLAGYCATLIISPWEIQWQVRTTLNRLLLQLLPAALFTVFLGLRKIA